MPETYIIKLNTNIGGMVGDLQEIEANIPLYIDGTLSELTEFVFEKSQDNCPIGPTGKLHQSGVVEHQPMVHTIVYRAPYSAAQEYGSPPHIIRAKNVKYLHWVGADGKDVFRKEVNHPGNPPRAFVRNAIAEGKATLEEISNKVFESTFGKFIGATNE
jgi:hypothetical protein